MSDESIAMREVPLSEKERNQRGRDLSAALRRLYDHQKRAKTQKKELKLQEEKLQGEVERLQRAVETGVEQVPAQDDLDFDN